MVGHVRSIVETGGPHREVRMMSPDERERRARAATGLLVEAVGSGTFPSAVWAWGDRGTTYFEDGLGKPDPTNSSWLASFDTVFDIASLTKIVAVWAPLGFLWSNSKLSLKSTVGSLLEDATGGPLDVVTVEQLLSHTAGLPPRANLKALYGTDPMEIRKGVLRESLHDRPGSTVRYTDRAALIAGYIVEELTSSSLDVAARELIWSRFGMSRTCFGPLSGRALSAAAPTAVDDVTGVHLKGVVHDFSARLLSGVSGISGVFSTVGDMGKFAQSILREDRTSPGFQDWLKLSLSVRTGDLCPSRGLFWHPAKGGSVSTWSHYGFTGTAIWLDFDQDRWAIMLTNKLYFTSSSDEIRRVREQFATILFGPK